MATGTATQCYTTTLMEETKGNDEEGVRSTAAIIYAGGFDTTLSAINTAIVALAANSVIQARAQAEMDVIVGSDRLPTFSDREQMPYMQCIISETFRWGATTPVGVPHRLCEDDYYRSYYLPKDSMIIANAWGMLRDPRVYPNPERFNPDRFLEGEGRTPQPDPRGPAFGFGRRICPGKDFAEDNFWLAVSNILYTFNISPALDENGKPLTIGIEFSENSIRHPKPFKCVIKPRRPNSVALIQQMADI